MGYTSLTPAEIPVAVVKAAKEEFKKNGLMRTEMKKIAENIGIGRATLYRYFSSIEPIAYLVATDYMDEISCSMEKYIEENKDKCENGVVLIRGVKKVQADYWMSNSDMLKFFSQFDSIYPPPYPDTSEAEHYSRSIARQQKVDVDVLKIGIEDGSVRTDIDVFEAYRTMSEALIGYIQRGEILHHYQGTLANANFLVDVFTDAIEK